MDPPEAAPEATATAPKGAKAKERSKKKKDKRKASAPAKSRQLLQKAKQVAETTVRAVDKELENRGQPGSSTDLPPHVESAMEATLEEAGGDKSLLRKARTKLGAATFVSRFHQKKADLLSARFTEKQAERRKKELKAAVLALREAEVNVKVKELEIALAEAGGVDSEAGDVDSEVGDGEVVDLEKEGEKSPGSVVPTTQVFGHEKVCRSLSGVPFEGCGFSLLPASGSVSWSHGSSLERGF